MEQEFTATSMSVENTLWTIRNIHIQDCFLCWPYKYSPFSILCFQIRTRFEPQYQGCHTTCLMCFDQQQPKFTAVYIGISRHAGLLLSSHKRALELHSPEYGIWHLTSDLWITNSTFAFTCSHGGVYVVTYSARKQPGLPQMRQPSLWLHRARRFGQYQENKPLWKRKKFSATPVYSEVVLLDGTHHLNAPMWEEPVSACYVK